MRLSRRVSGWIRWWRSRYVHRPQEIQSTETEVDMCIPGPIRSPSLRRPTAFPPRQHESQEARSAIKDIHGSPERSAASYGVCERYARNQSRIGNERASVDGGRGHHRAPMARHGRQARRPRGRSNRWSADVWEQSVEGLQKRVSLPPPLLSKTT